MNTNKMSRHTGQTSSELNPHSDELQLTVLTQQKNVLCTKSYDS